jgi:hypothetical protein
VLTRTSHLVSALSHRPDPAMQIFATSLVQANTDIFEPGRSCVRRVCGTNASVTSFTVSLSPCSRPLLFRATSTAPLRSFRGSRVAHPHANVLSADAFARGVIRSGTDYSVYDQAGLDGIDLAFYKGRSRYHTKYDTIPHLDWEHRSLWAMMDAARGSGLALLNEDATHEQTGSAVYFDREIHFLPFSRFLLNTLYSVRQLLRPLLIEQFHRV